MNRKTFIADAILIAIDLLLILAINNWIAPAIQNNLTLKIVIFLITTAFVVTTAVFIINYEIVDEDDDYVVEDDVENKVI